MEALFLKILNMSISAGWLIAFVFVLRLLFKKLPKSFNYILWALVAIRLICPFTIESALSLIPSAETVPQEILHTSTPAIHTGIEPLNTYVNPMITESLAPEVGASVNPMQVVTFVASILWITGIVVMLLYMGISYLMLRRKVRASMHMQENVWLCDEIDSPFILGMIRPRIYLHSDIEEGQIPYIMAHEKEHLKYRDYLWKPLGFLILAIHWFNPLVWLSYILMCRDMELACDERVIQSMDVDEKKKYSNVLLSCSAKRRVISACPVAFGEVGVKQRIKSVVNYKKPAFWIICVAFVVCVVSGVCFLTNPKEDAKVSKEEYISEEQRRATEYLRVLFSSDKDRYQHYINASGGKYTPLLIDKDFLNRDYNQVYVHMYGQYCTQNGLLNMQTTGLFTIVDYFANIANSNVIFKDVMFMPQEVKIKLKNTELYYFVVTLNNEKDGKTEEFTLNGQMSLQKNNGEWKVSSIWLNDYMPLSIHVTGKNIYASSGDVPMQQKAITKTSVVIENDIEKLTVHATEEIDGKKYECGIKFPLEYADKDKRERIREHAEYYVKTKNTNLVVGYVDLQTEDTLYVLVHLFDQDLYAQTKDSDVATKYISFYIVDWNDLKSQP